MCAGKLSASIHVRMFGMVRGLPHPPCGQPLGEKCSVNPHSRHLPPPRGLLLTECHSGIGSDGKIIGPSLRGDHSGSLLSHFQMRVSQCGAKSSFPLAPVSSAEKNSTIFLAAKKGWRSSLKDFNRKQSVLPENKRVFVINKRVPASHKKVFARNRSVLTSHNSVFAAHNSVFAKN